MARWRTIGVVCLLAIAGCPEPAREPSPAELQQMRSLESEIAAAIEEAVPRRIASLRAASEGLQPSSEGQACPQEIPPRTDVGFDVHTSVLERRQLEPDYDLYQDTRPESQTTNRLGMIARRMGYRGSRMQGLTNVHSSLERHLAEGGWQMEGEDPFAFYTSWRDRLDWELVLVVDAYRAPEHDGTSFTDGILRGQAFVYDFAADEVVCAATIDASSSEQVGVRFDPTREGLRQNQALIDDLHDNAFDQAIERLKAAEPREPGGDEDVDEDEGEDESEDEDESGS